MPLIFAAIVSLVAFAATYVAAWRYPRGSALSPTPSIATAQAVGEEVAKHSRLGRFDRRLDPATATGLALTIALICAIGGGIVLAILAYLVRSNGVLLHLDRDVAQWGHDNAGHVSTQGLTFVTNLAATPTVLVLAVVLAVVESVRAPNRWIVPFLAAVLIGEGLLALIVKNLAHRARPAFDPIAATLGPAFPSGHTTTAAAFYAGAALLLGRRRGPRAHAILAAGAVGLAIAVACSRVLLDLHWVSDVVGGLALGWAWFAVCSVAFGGRLLQFGAGLESGTEAASSLERHKHLTSS